MPSPSGKSYKTATAKGYGKKKKPAVKKSAKKTKVKKKTSKKKPAKGRIY